MSHFEVLKEYLDHIFRELAEAKRIIIGLETIDRERSEWAWDDLMSVSAELSCKWQGPTAVEEIRLQREKG